VHEDRVRSPSSVDDGWEPARCATRAQGKGLSLRQQARRECLGCNIEALFVTTQCGQLTYGRHNPHAPLTQLALRELQPIRRAGVPSRCGSEMDGTRVSLSSPHAVALSTRRIQLLHPPLCWIPLHERKSLASKLQDRECRSSVFVVLAAYCQPKENGHQGGNRHGQSQEGFSQCIVYKMYQGFCRIPCSRSYW